MKKNTLFIVSLLTTILFTACSVVDPMESEQYQKDIYIIGANERISSFSVPYGSGQEAFVSISASGTQKVDRDVDVTLKRNDDIINWYNNKYMLDAPVKYRQLDQAMVNVPSWITTLKAGELYTHLSFSVNTTGLHCDSLYAIGFAIESVSDYQMSESGTELIFTLKLANAYSGNYHLDATKTMLKEEALDDGGTEWVEQGLPVPVSVQRTLTATSENTVRFFHEKTKETLAEYSNSWDPGKDYFDAIKNSCIQFVRTTGNTFTVEPWGDMRIVDGAAEYENNIVTFWYDYMEGSNRYRMSGTFRK
jgi:hypothetical protein